MKKLGKHGEPWTSSAQHGSPGPPGHCLVAQVWDRYGMSIARLDATEDPMLATVRGIRIAACVSALTGCKPETLKALVEAAKALYEHPGCNDPDCCKASIEEEAARKKLGKALEDFEAGQ